jgi:hypothetical protein
MRISSSSLHVAELLLRLYKTIKVMMVPMTAFMILMMMTVQKTGWIGTPIQANHRHWLLLVEAEKCLGCRHKFLIVTGNMHLQSF